MALIDHELEFLLSLDGTEFRLMSGFVIKIEANRVAANATRPHRLKDSPTLHDASRQRLIVTREPRSVSELADMAHRAPQNVQRTLRRLSDAGIVCLKPGGAHDPSNRYRAKGSYRDRSGALDDRARSAPERRRRRSTKS